MTGTIFTHAYLLFVSLIYLNYPSVGNKLNNNKYIYMIVTTF